MDRVDWPVRGQALVTTTVYSSTSSPFGPPPAIAFIITAVKIANIFLKHPQDLQLKSEVYIYLGWSH